MRLLFIHLSPRRQTLLHAAGTILWQQYRSSRESCALCRQPPRRAAAASTLTSVWYGTPARIGESKLGTATVKIAVFAKNAEALNKLCAPVLMFCAGHNRPSRARFSNHCAFCSCARPTATARWDEGPEIFHRCLLLSAEQRTGRPPVARLPGVPYQAWCRREQF